MGFIRAGGFQTAKNVGVVKQPTLVIWGRNDRILDPKLYVERFRREMAADALRGVHVIEECGHVPHLEKPEVVAELIHDFVQTHCVGHY
jgi:pimeloyl-ACP methyl ester carboxylesterase